MGTDQIQLKRLYILLVNEHIAELPKAGVDAINDPFFFNNLPDRLMAFVHSLHTTC
ncbi:Uncharacterised protein [Mycobacteroides abscessus subsp. abscessus]|nr:Uncharacterised protein [Mycobacteroides abscessus subsp. abscessus]